MISWWISRRQALLMMAWRIVDRLRRRLVQSQAWLEQHIDGWGDECAFNATPSSAVSVDAPAPEHWVELVRNSAPWLLRNGQDKDAGGRHMTSVVAVHSESDQSPTNATESRQRSVDAAVRVGSEVTVSEVTVIDAIGPGEQEAAPSALSDKAVRNFRIVRRSPDATLPLVHQNAELGSLIDHRRLSIEPAGGGATELPAEEEIDAGIAASRNTHHGEEKLSGGQVPMSRDLIHAEERSDGAQVADRRHISHAESIHEGPARSSAMKPSGRDAFTRRPSWPALPDESGQPDTIDDPWPSLALENSSEGDDPFAQTEEGQRQCGV